MTFVPSDAQRRAIEAPPGPVLVVAGPGAGKTFCLIARIGHLIAAHGIEPRRICAVTFTNKAADEIATRLRREIGPAADEVTRGTLHALCLTLLREHADTMGLRRGFGIADEEYQRRLLRRLRVRPERQAYLLGLFGRHRLQHAPLHPRDLELFHAYRDALEARNLLDYDDLIARAGELLRCHPASAALIRRRWDSVLVDEFQDLSLAQYEVVTSLSRDHRHCFAVGDDEQSIFSWTGADPAILQRFSTDHGIECPIVLDRNRRCSRQIFEAARRLVTRNPALFDKQLDADRDSEHCVGVEVFEDERAEAAWLIADLERDRAEAGLEWGDYALLYRAHRIGQYLETAMVEAGIPCRLARGQALTDDEVIGYVVSSLGVIRAPDDPLALEGFAERTLPRTLLDQLRMRFRDLDLVTALRAYARSVPRGEPDARKAWRFVFHVENLASLRRSHESIGPLVDELLGQRLGPYRNPLEERAAELTDPAEFPGARHLADRVAETQARRAITWVQPDRGVEIPLLRMLRTALGDYVRTLEPGSRPSPGDLVLRAGAARPLLVFKALQLLHCRGLDDPYQDYVAFDIETTDLDPSGCEIVELAAVRVRGRVIVQQWSRLVRPTGPVSPAASRVHGYVDADLCDQPTFDQVWPEFRAFVGGDILVAHNGQEFDVPVLRRLAAGLPGVDELVFFDTLPLARSLLEESARLGDLAHRFGVDAGRSHHALDDASTLVGVLRHLGDLKVSRSRKAALPQLLGWLGLALALDGAEPTAEERVLKDIALPAALGRYGDCLEVYAEACEAAGAPPVEELIERLGGRRLMDRIRTERSAAERYPASVARLQALVEASDAATLDDSIDLLLGRVALSRSDGAAADHHRINLLTLHSTKGLEFSRVYVIGAEDAQIPGFRALEEENDSEICEARRLLYVGMTRARDRLVLTRVERRDGRFAGGDLFLREAGLGAEAHAGGNGASAAG
ncbi:MAG TPA: UvrD-helicase domain-containing protein [Gemmatimonadales bacterium]|nr:UvrD-helicase domain-containing protein [Gemmatimonadales bacterium]